MKRHILVLVLVAVTAGATVAEAATGYGNSLVTTDGANQNVSTSLTDTLSGPASIRCTPSSGGHPPCGHDHDELRGDRRGEQSDLRQFPGQGGVPAGIWWLTKAPMPTNRIELGAATAANGRVYAIGGEAQAIQLATVEEYDPPTDTWTTSTSMQTPRTGLTVAAGKNGRIYAIGGWNTSQWQTVVEEFDPGTFTWVYKAGMPTPRAWYSGATATNGKIYVAGGQSTGYQVISTVEEYDPVTNTWATKASLPAPRYWHGTAAATNGKIYVIGGHSGTSILASVTEYDPATNTWTNKADMPTPRWNLRAVGTSDGKVYAIGGHDGVQGLSTVEQYDPTSNTWATMTDMPAPLAGMGLTEGTNGKIYAIGAGSSEAVTLEAGDATPPVITPSISGNSGNNGWYTSSVTVTWTVTEPLSGIASSSGCDPSALTADTAGMTLTCAAISAAGLSSSTSVTVKIDKTAPALILPDAITVAPTSSAGTAVSFSASVTDTLSGPASFSCTPGSGATFPVGRTTVSCAATDEAGNLASGSFWITVRVPGIDLTVPVLSAPASAVAGRPISVTWTVTNQGDEDALPTWYDRVYLSMENTWDGTDLFLSNLTRTVTLAPGNRYTLSQSVTVPWIAPGPYYLIVRTDMWGNVAESDETNNQQVVPIVVVSPDLVVSSLTAPGVGVIGRTIPITWTVRNQGSGAALPSWTDRLHLISDSSYDDPILVNTRRDTAVTAGDSYTVTANVTLPRVTTGSYYLLLRVDPHNALLEVSETNNSRMVPLTIGGPDLTPTALTTPATAKPGQTVPITWTVKNQGLSDTLPTWYDRVYLSTDLTYDSGDTLLTNVTRTFALLPGSSYTTSRGVYVPKITPGSYYLIFRTDQWNSVSESDETNNQRVVPLTIGLPDLTPTAFTVPASGKPWQVVSATWTIKNQGPIDGPPSWEDRVYLSTDSAWNSGDTVLAKVTHGVTVVAGDSYTVSTNVTLPATGSYYLILRTDVWGQVAETDETNNSTAVAIVVAP